MWSNDNVFLLKNKKDLVPRALEINPGGRPLSLKRDKLSQLSRVTVAAYSAFKQKVTVELHLRGFDNNPPRLYSKEVFITQLATNIDFDIAAAPEAGAYLVATMRAGDKRLARDVHIVPPRGGKINILLLGFHPSFTIKTIKLFCEKYSGYQYTSRDFYSPQAQKESRELEAAIQGAAGQLLIMVDPPPQAIDIALKKEQVFLWVSTKRTEASSVFSAEDLDLSHPFTDFKGDPALTRRFWKAMKLRVNPRPPPPQAKIFHRRQSQSAWFETAAYHYLGLTPLVQSRSDIIAFCEILYPLLQSLHSRAQLRLPLSSGTVNNFTGDNIKALESISLLVAKRGKALETSSMLSLDFAKAAVFSYQAGETLAPPPIPNLSS